MYNYILLLAALGGVASLIVISKKSTNPSPFVLGTILFLVILLGIVLGIVATQSGSSTHML